MDKAGLSNREIPTFQSEKGDDRMDDDLLENSREETKDDEDNTEASNTEESECEEESANLLERLRGPKEVRPLPQLRNFDAEKDKMVTPVKDSERMTTCWNCEAEWDPGHQCDVTAEKLKLKWSLC